MGWSVFLLPPPFFCLARSEQGNDRVGIRYTIRDIGGNSWNHHSLATAAISLLNFPILLFCILLLIHQSFKESIGLDEASCPSRWSYPCFLNFLYSSLAAGLGLVVPPKPSFPLAYRGVQAAWARWSGQSVTFKWSLFRSRPESPPCFCSASPEETLLLVVAPT